MASKSANLGWRSTLAILLIGLLHAGCGDDDGPGAPDGGDGGSGDGQHDVGGDGDPGRDDGRGDGDDDGPFVIGGERSGLDAQVAVGLDLNDGEQRLDVHDDGPFEFHGGLYRGDDYHVVVDHAPDGWSCWIENGSGTVTRDVRDIALRCAGGRTLRGSVSGLRGVIELRLHDGTTLTLDAEGPFVFPAGIEPGESYLVTVARQPEGQSCVVQGFMGEAPEGEAGALEPVDVLCTDIPEGNHTLGGTIEGLQGVLELQLEFGPGTEPDAELVTEYFGPGRFRFARSVRDGYLYRITVATAPQAPRQQCSISPDSGSVGGGSIEDLRVTCETERFAVGGSLVGLPPGESIELELGDETRTLDADGSFAFDPLDDLTRYDVQIASPPAGVKCQVRAGRGQLQGGPVGSVIVACLGVRSVTRVPDHRRFFDRPFVTAAGATPVESDHLRSVGSITFSRDDVDWRDVTLTPSCSAELRTDDYGSCGPGIEWLGLLSPDETCTIEVDSAPLPLDPSLDSIAFRPWGTEIARVTMPAPDWLELELSAFAGADGMELWGPEGPLGSFGIGQELDAMLDHQSDYQVQVSSYPDAEPIGRLSPPGNSWNFRGFALRLADAHTVEGSGSRRLCLSFSGALDADAAGDTGNYSVAGATVTGAEPGGCGDPEAAAHHVELTLASALSRCPEGESWDPNRGAPCHAIQVAAIEHAGGGLAIGSHHGRFTVDARESTGVRSVQGEASDRVLVRFHDEVQEAGAQMAASYQVARLGAAGDPVVSSAMRGTVACGNATDCVELQFTSNLEHNAFYSLAVQGVRTLSGADVDTRAAPARFRSPRFLRVHDVDWQHRDLGFMQVEEIRVRFTEDVDDGALELCNYSSDTLDLSGADVSRGSGLDQILITGFDYQSADARTLDLTVGDGGGGCTPITSGSGALYTGESDAILVEYSAPIDHRRNDDGPLGLMGTAVDPAHYVLDGHGDLRPVVLFRPQPSAVLLRTGGNSTPCRKLPSATTLPLRAGSHSLHIGAVRDSTQTVVLDDSTHPL